MELDQIIAWRTAPDLAVRLVSEHALADVKEAIKKKSFNALGELGEYLQLFPGRVMGIPNAPSPLTSALVGGLTGAGIGYGLGLGTEAMLPADWEPGKARKSFAMMGGLLGASPGLLWGATNLNSGRPFFSHQTGSNGGSGVQFDVAPAGMDDKIASVVEKSFTKLSAGVTGLFGVPPISVDRFNDLIWQDPFVSNQLSLPQQAAASGFMTGAANLPGKATTQLITPLDVGRMAAGMGSGFLSGALVGKLFGLLLGMPDATQNRLKQTGMFAGLLANALPLLYGG